VVSPLLIYVYHLFLEFTILFFYCRFKTNDDRDYNYTVHEKMSPQEKFLSDIDDDEARDIVKRCLIPSQRLLLSDEIGKGKVINIHVSERLL